MLTGAITDLYKRFRLMNYRILFGRIRERDGSLSATEAYTVDVIFLLGDPTITKLAETLGISQPNATYKVNNLAAKGYVMRLPSSPAGRIHPRGAGAHGTDAAFALEARGISAAAKTGISSRSPETDLRRALLFYLIHRNIGQRRPIDLYLFINYR